MTITAKVIADSINTATSDRLTTMLVRMPRCVLAEFKDHRSFSRTTAGELSFSRARADVNADQFLPDLLTVGNEEMGRSIWTTARKLMDGCHRQLEMLGVAKQIANRLLEPWMYTEVLVSATDWQNFFSLRCNAQADPAIQGVSDAMLAAYVESTPAQLNSGEWHLPFAGQWAPSEKGITLADRIAICVARAARTSYFGFDGENSLEKDLQLYARLSESGHWSPFEHVAQALRSDGADLSAEHPTRRIGNFTGWRQHRYDFARQNRQCDLPALLKERRKVSVYAKGGSDEI